jgi:hypothetical protein
VEEVPGDDEEADEDDEDDDDEEDEAFTEAAACQIESSTDVIAPRQGWPLPRCFTPGAAPLLWPPGRTRCPFDVRCPLRPHGCLRGNPTHLLEESHTVEHVRRQARKVDWAHPLGPLYQLVRDAGLPHTHCTTKDACLRALDTALDAFEVAGARHGVPSATAGDYAAMAPEPVD